MVRNGARHWQRESESVDRNSQDSTATRLMRSFGMAGLLWIALRKSRSGSTAPNASIILVAVLPAEHRTTLTALQLHAEIDSVCLVADRLVDGEATSRNLLYFTPVSKQHFQKPKIHAAFIDDAGTYKPRLYSSVLARGVISSVDALAIPSHSVAAIQSSRY